ncbi:MAG: hypothetical protein ACT4O9_04995 [Blastocatellia bacterium]
MKTRQIGAKREVEENEYLKRVSQRLAERNFLKTDQQQAEPLW